GGRVSSVLNVITDPGDGELDVRGGISVLATRVSVGGSVPGIENSRVRVGVRRSYFDQLLKPFLDFPYHLTDAQLAGEVWTSARDRFGVTAYLGEDVLELSGADSFPLRVDWKWGNAVAGARWSRVLRHDGLFEVRSSYSRFSTEMTFPDFGDTRFTSRIEHALLRADGTWPIRNVELRAGLETNRMWYDNLVVSGGTVFNSARDVGWAHGAYAQTSWRLRGNLLIESGLRGDVWSADDGSTFLLSPRFAVKRFLAQGNVAVKIAAGRYTQFLHSLRDEELPVGIDVWVLSGTRAPQVRSDQVQTGLELFRGDWYAAVESYWRRFRGVATNNFAQDPNDPVDDILAGDGLSYGADAVIRKDRGRVTGFATVSWLKAEREFPDFLQGAEDPQTIAYPPIFDRRFELDVVLRFPFLWRWEGGMRFNYGSGLPYTRPIGSYLFYEYQLNSGRRAHAHENEDFTNVLLGQRNAERYPDYHRLDLSLRKTFTKSWGTLTPHFDILNLYNRKNVLFYFYEYDVSPPVRSGISMFPFLPTVGVEVTF
ncbi:MAG TPA: TonB-dependent receptor, partial [Longimicrobiales bacterium]